MLEVKKRCDIIIDKLLSLTFYSGRDRYNIVNLRQIMKTPGGVWLILEQFVMYCWGVFFVVYMYKVTFECRSES